MRPLVLRDIASELDLHESTVSRVTSRKYVQTPRGVFELKYFFSNRVANAEGGGASATAIRARLRKIIEGEEPGRPWSDQRLASDLERAGFRVARRTVAKYRESMGIPPSNERRRAGGRRRQRSAPDCGTSRRTHSMQLNVTGRRLVVTEALESYARTKLARLERHFDHVTNVHVVLSVERERHRAEATVHVTGRELFADAIEGEMYAAIDALADKLDRQIKRYKEKTTDHHRESGGTEGEPPLGAVGISAEARPGRAGPGCVATASARAGRGRASPRMNPAPPPRAPATPPPPPRNDRARAG